MPHCLSQEKYMPFNLYANVIFSLNMIISLNDCSNNIMQPPKTKNPYKTKVLYGSNAFRYFQNKRVRVVSSRIELEYQVPETCVLSIVLRDQFSRTSSLGFPAGGKFTGKL